MDSQEHIDKIRDLILAYYNISESDFLSDSRRKPTAEARQVFMYCLREKYKLSFPIIARMLNKDHTTALYAYKKIQKAIYKDRRLDNFIDSILDNEKVADLNKIPMWQWIRSREEEMGSDSSLGNSKEDDTIDNNKSLSAIEDDSLFKNENKNYSFPIRFDSDYLKSVFTGIDDRSKNIFKNRYGFGNDTLRTLDDIGKNENVSRERVRQIIAATIKKLFKNNYHDVGQVVYFVYDKIKQNKIVSIEKIVNEIFIVNKKEEASAAKFLTAIISVGRNIKKFELSGRVFFININEEDNILKEIDNIKLLIGKVKTEVPESVKDKKDYVLEKVKEIWNV